jgi:tripartite-type tricarboxylate transporter receptor subunit TctC
MRGSDLFRNLPDAATTFLCSLAKFAQFKFPQRANAVLISAQLSGQVIGHLRRDCRANEARGWPGKPSNDTEAAATPTGSTRTVRRGRPSETVTREGDEMRSASKVLGLFLLSGLALAWGESCAQSYPSKPIRLVTGNQAGGGTDILARGIAAKLAERLGQPVIVENRPGADGIIATEYVARSASDGYTLLVGADGQMVLNLGLYAQLPYDPVKDFAPITRISSNPLVIAVHPSVPVTSIAELVVLAKAKPGELFYASGAPVFHVATELFKKQAGVNIIHVRYKGAAPALTAILAGEAGVIMSAVGPILSQLRAGKLRGLAVTSPSRYGIIPDIPTMAESGQSDFEVVPWTGLFAPVGTPRAIIDKLNRELAIVLNFEDLKERFAARGVSLGGTSPEELSTLLQADIAKWMRIMKDLNIRAQ